MKKSVRWWICVLQVLLALGVMLSLPANGEPLEPSEEQLIAREKLGKVLSGARLLWVNDHKIYHTMLDEWNPELVTKSDRQEYRPRWSRDGAKILFQRGPDRVFMMDADFSNQQEVLRGARTADWTGDGAGITAIASDGYRVLHYRLADGEVSVLYDSRRPPYDGQTLAQSAVLHPSGRYLLSFRREPSHASFIVDLVKKQYLANQQMLRGDCKPAWSPDGKFLLTTARTSNRPILRASFDKESGDLGTSEVLVRMDKGLRYYMHDAQVSTNGQWLLFGGKVLLGASMLGRREIYIWRFASDIDDIIRLTFDTNDDDTPSLYVPSE